MASIRCKAALLFIIVAICVSLLSLLSFHLSPSYAFLNPVPRFPSEISGRLLMARSSGYVNYRRLEDKSLPFQTTSVSQRDASLYYHWFRFFNTPEGSFEKLDAQKKMFNILNDRMRVDNIMNLIGKVLFGFEKGIQVLNAVRQEGQPLVDDWDCHKSMIRIFVRHCGSLSEYGMKHSHSLANICNAGISKETMSKVCAEVCSQFIYYPLNSLRRGGSTLPFSSPLPF